MLLIVEIKTQTFHKETTLRRRFLSENLLISQLITINDQSISLQCFDSVVGRQEGHPARKKTFASKLPEMAVNVSGWGVHVQMSRIVAYT